MLVFAYGSNLNLKDYARQYDPSQLRPGGRAWLPDHTLAFSRYSASRDGGVLNLRGARGSVAPGLLFEVTSEGLAALDRKEGHPRHYRRQEVTVLGEGGEEIPAMTYIAPDAGFVAPNDAYVQIVGDGMRELGVDGLSVLQAAARNEPPPAGVAGVFVYGTLLAGECRADLLEGNMTDPARVRGRLLDLGAYPGLCEGDGHVQGELVRLDHPAHTLQALDRVEGFRGFGVAGSLFRRTLVRAESEAESEASLAWAYQYAGAGTETVIPGGSWRARSVASTGRPMADALARIRTDISALSETGSAGFDPEAPGRMTFGGAGLVVRDGQIPPFDEHPWRSADDDLHVVTPHARALAWLLLRLRDEVLCHWPDRSVYRLVGAAAAAHHAGAGWSTRRATLLAAVAAAESHLLLTAGS